MTKPSLKWEIFKNPGNRTTTEHISCHFCICSSSHNKALAMHPVHGVHVFNYKMAQVSLRYCAQQISMSPIKLVYVGLNFKQYKIQAAGFSKRRAFGSMRCWSNQAVSLQRRIADALHIFFWVLDNYYIYHTHTHISNISIYSIYI